MAQTINTNVMSLNAQRNLNTNNASLATTIQRLSSGLRINSAKDDAAGLAISQRMTTQIKGLAVAVRNANDGISLAQTTEGAMEEIGNNLQRIRELAVQAANATNSASDRQALQAEVDQLVSEIDRIAKQTNFNGTNVLDGSFTGALFQVGANAGQAISISKTVDAKASSLGSLARSTGTQVSAATANDITIAMGSLSPVSIASSADYATSINGQDASSAFAKAAALNASGIEGLYASAKTTGTQAVGPIGGNASDTYNLTINGAAIFSNTDVSTALTNTQLRDAINAASNQTGVVATLSGGSITLTAIDGRNIAVTESGTGFTAGTDGLTVAAGPFVGTLRGQVSLTGTDSIVVGGTVANIGLGTNITKDTLGITKLDLSTYEGANEVLMRMDSALTSVNGARADMGAIQNRFTSVIANLSTNAENLSASRGRILDADYAAETAELTRTQILQQAGTAMLAQANTIPQSVLKLLGQ